MSNCVFPGSFDPVTKGHVDLIQRASGLFDKVTVTLMVNVHKNGFIPLEDRIRLLKKACADMDHVRIDRWDGLLADYMKKQGEHIVIRGIRSTSEFEQEYSASLINRKLYDRLETILIPADPELCSVSSTAVREIAAFGGDISDLVPAAIRKDITDLLSKMNRKGR